MLGMVVVSASVFGFIAGLIALVLLIGALGALLGIVSPTLIGMSSRGAAFGALLFFVVAWMVLGFVGMAIEGDQARTTVQPDTVEAQSDAPPVTQLKPEPTAAPKGAEIGSLCDNTGHCIGYASKVLTAQEYGPGWPFAKPSVTLVCPKVDAVRIFVLGDQPYAANGFTQTFSIKWEVTLEVNGKSQSISKYEGAVGLILMKVDAICA